MVCSYCVVMFTEPANRSSICHDYIGADELSSVSRFRSMGDGLVSSRKSAESVDDCEPSTRMTLFSWLSLIVMGAVCLMPTRFIPWFSGGLPIRFAHLWLVLFATAVTIIAIIRGGVRDWSLMWRRVVRSWPIIVMAVIDLSVWLLTFLNRNQPGLALYQHLRYWAMFAFAFVAPLSAYQLGLFNRRLGNRRLGVFLAIITGVSFAFCAAEYARLVGYENILSTWLLQLDRVHVEGFPIWTIGPNEPLRAKGLGVWPVHPAVFALIASAWGLASQKYPRLRVTVLLFSFGILTLSASRTAFIAMFFMVVLWAGGNILRMGVKSWMKHDGFILVAMVIAVAGFFSVLHFVPASSQGVVGRLALSTTAITEVADQEESVGAAAADVTNGRTIIWKKALGIIRTHPLGSGFPFVITTGTGGHAHSEYLERLVWGGPLMLFGFLAFWFWIMCCIETPAAPSFGLLVVGGLGLYACAEVVTMTHGFVAPVAFIAGVLTSERWIDGNTRFISRLDR